MVIPCHRPTLVASLLAASSVLLATAAPLKVQRQLSRPSPSRPGLLQATENSQPFAEPAKGVGWFAEDAHRIAQMPPYIPDARAQKHPACSPVCTYSCGHSECDQLCEPICLPPQCETLCTKSEDKCDTRCNEPKCAVICPLQHECTDPTNADGGCPKSKCRTICAPPVCTTSCSDSCHSVCSQPQCNWKCKPGNCPKPECKMKCPSCITDPLKFSNSNLTKVPIMPGADVKAEGRASLDPAILSAPPDPAPPPVVQIIPQKYKESSIGWGGVPAAVTTPSPMKRLRMKWKAEDLHEENDRMHDR